MVRVSCLLSDRAVGHDRVVGRRDTLYGAYGVQKSGADVRSFNYEIKN